jgi:hypothetical protein
MATTCKVYLSDALPIEVRNAHRALYFPDGSVHVLDKKDRPVFIAAPGRFTAVVMEYALDEEAEESQKVPAPMQKRPSREIVPVVPIQPKQETPPQRPQGPQGPPPGFPPVGESKPAPESTPGEVRISSLQERGSDAETTHEMKIPLKEVPHQDFLTAPKAAGRQ